MPIAATRDASSRGAIPRTTRSAYILRICRYLCRAWNSNRRVLRKANPTTGSAHGRSRRHSDAKASLIADFSR
jgi:hypothetical protein